MTYMAKYCVVTHPKASKKAWVWLTTKSGNKCRQPGVGGLLFNILSRNEGLTGLEFIKKHDVDTYSTHVEIEPTFEIH